MKVAARGLEPRRLSAQDPKSHPRLGWGGESRCPAVPSLSPKWPLWDLNPQPSRDRLLRPACMPIPPSGRRENFTVDGDRKKRATTFAHRPPTLEWFRPSSKALDAKR